MKFLVEIEQTLVLPLIVEANNPQDAVEAAKREQHDLGNTFYKEPLVRVKLVEDDYE